MNANDEWDNNRPTGRKMADVTAPEPAVEPKVEPAAPVIAEKVSEPLVRLNRSMRSDRFVVPGVGPIVTKIFQSVSASDLALLQDGAELSGVVLDVKEGDA